MVTKYILKNILHYNLTIWICTSPVKLRFSHKSIWQLNLEQFAVYPYPCFWFYLT